MGRQQFEKVVASAPREKLKRFITSVSTPIAAGASEIVDLFTSTGTVGISQSGYFYVDKPVGSATGQHSITVTSSYQNGDYLYGSSAYNVDIHYNHRRFVSASLQQSPTSDTGQIMATKENLFDEITGFRFVYTNGTNVAQANLRTYAISYIERVRG
jgi:hypothetical protein